MSWEKFDAGMASAYEEMYEREESALIKKGYEIVNVSSVFPGVREVASVNDIRPEYELRSIKTGEVIAGYIDCSYSCALFGFKKKVDDIIKEANAAQQRETVAQAS